MPNLLAVAPLEEPKPMKTADRRQLDVYANAVGSERGAPVIFADRAPTAEARAVFNGRLAELRAAIGVTASPKELGAELASLFAGTGNTAVDPDEIRITIANYAQALRAEALPVWAVRVAVDRWRRGALGFASLGRAPTSPEICKVARSVVQRWRDELNTLHRVLTARILERPQPSTDRADQILRENGFGELVDRRRRR